MGILDFFKPLKKKTTLQRWKELNVYNATFTVFGNDIYNSQIVRSCIRPLADFSAKAEAKCDDVRLQNMLNYRPNIYMNGKDFIYKVRTKLELLNTAFIYIERDNRNSVIGLYPVPYSYFEALEYLNGLFIKFYFSGEAVQTLTLPWEDLAVLRKDYNKSDIVGDDNTCIIETLELLNTANQGLANAIKATANLRGILKSTKAMLAPDAVRQAKDEFVKDYLGLENSGGIAALDSTQEFTPIKMEPSTATYEQMKEIRENIYRYFGVNDDFVTGNMKSDFMENFYRMKIEPFLVALSRELTSKIYPKGNKQVIYQADQFAFVTLDKKIQLFSTVVLYGGMTINEWRSLFNLGPIEGGDKPVRRLDAAPIDENVDPDDQDPDSDDKNEEEEEEKNDDQ